MDRETEATCSCWMESTTSRFSETTTTLRSSTTSRSSSFSLTMTSRNSEGSPAESSTLPQKPEQTPSTDQHAIFCATSKLMLETVSFRLENHLVRLSVC